MSLSLLGTAASLGADAASFGTDVYFTNQYLQGGSIDQMLADGNRQMGGHNYGTPQQQATPGSWNAFMPVASIACVSSMMMLMLTVLLLAVS